MIKRSPLILAMLICVLLAAPWRPAAAKETWTSVRSKHFFLVGNASERDIQKVATKLEQFRDIFSRLFTKANLNLPVPTTVIVFKSDGAYRPFKPLYQGKPSDVSGYFQSGEDVNYITLTSELREANPYAVIFHEYVHALTNDNTQNSPPWFSEGLAEFYSTLDVSDGEKKVWLGKPIANHVLFLRQKKFLPLATLFEVDHGSPHYNERDKKGVFYAESWALIHYFMLGNNGQRQPQFLRYLNLLAAGTPIGESFQQAFQADYATIEKELREYINRDAYPVRIFPFDQRLGFDKEMQSAPVSEAEAQCYLGDLLLHIRRLDDAETYLQQAIKLDPNLAPAQASLGMLRMRQKNFAQAKQYLQRAVEANSQNYLAHYYYAFTLSREGMDERQFVQGYAPEVAQTMRAELKKAINLAPGFPESYHLLAFINLVTGEQLDESILLLNRALTLAQGRRDFSLILAQLYLRKQDYEAARRTVEPIARNDADPQTRARAQSLLDTITRITEQMARYKSERDSFSAEATKPEETPRTMIEPKRPTLRRRPEGEQVRGLLTRIDCTDKGLTLVIKTNDREVRLHSDRPDRVEFITYTQEVGQSITCGARNPATPVLVTYRTSTDASSKFDGEPLAVEFVKPQ